MNFAATQEANKVIIIIMLTLALPSIGGAVLIQGEWSGSEQYQSGDVVSWHGNLYQAAGTPLIGACPYSCKRSVWVPVEPAMTEQIADEHGNYVVTIYGTVVIRSRP